MDFDLSVMTFIAEHRVRAIDRFTRATMTAGTSITVLGVVALIGIAYVVWRRQWRVAVAVPVVFVAANVVGALLKKLIDRPRPPAYLALAHAPGLAMPSTHAAWTASVGMAVVLAFAWPSARVRRIGTIAIGVGVIGTGCCLVYLGVHWPTDVLVGWVLGVAIGGGVGYAARRAASGTQG